MVNEGPVKAGVTRINEEGADVCNKLGMKPNDALIWLDRELMKWRGEKILDRVVEDKVRKICQIEGVMLHEKQKGFFRDLFTSLMKFLRPAAAVSEPGGDEEG